MQIDEFTADRMFAATIHLHEATKTTTVRTEIRAENATEAKLKLTALYKKGSVLSFDIAESELKSHWGTQTLSADQLAKQSVKDAKTRIDATDDAKRLSRKIATAQHKAVKDAAKRFRDCQ